MIGYIYQPLAYINGMSCQIVNISTTVELIPNGSPNFLTKATRSDWEKSKYYTSWIAENDIVDTVDTGVMFATKSQPTQLQQKEKSKLMDKRFIGPSLEKKTRREKTENSQAHVHATKESDTMMWWKSIGNLGPTSDRSKWWNHLTVVAEDVQENEWDVRKKDVKKNIENTRERMRNHLPVPETILGAFVGDVILVRLRSLNDSDLLMSADDVSNLCLY
jgi:hypothetical protein